MKSLSQLSIVQEATKKMKNTKKEGTSSDNQSNPFDEIEFNLHKFSKYLTNATTITYKFITSLMELSIKEKERTKFYSIKTSII